MCVKDFLIFFFKQKTAYELRISDWSSDVCSSDLGGGASGTGGDRPYPGRLALLIGLCIILIQPILLIFGGIVMASMLDGGTRLLGRILPIARGWRLLIVCLSLVAFLGWTMLFAGSQIADQAATLQTVVMAQIERIAAWASDHGMGNFQLDAKTIADNIAGTVGRVTAAVDRKSTRLNSSP